VFFTRKKSQKKCVFCGSVDATHIYERDYGYHCSNLDRCKDNLISIHVRKFPVSRKEAFQILGLSGKFDVFLSSLHQEIRRDPQGSRWHSKIEITGALLVSRSFQGVGQPDLLVREFPDPVYSCKIPVAIAIKFDDDLFKQADRQRIAGKLKFYGSYHANYGVTSNVIGQDPIVINLELFAPSFIQEKIISEIKYCLIVKNIFDAVNGLEERQQLQRELKIANESGDLALPKWADRVNLVNKSGMKGLNYSLKTTLKCHIPGLDNPRELDQSKSTENFLNIDDWSLDVKI
jgi:hypothetical protein